jgi:hypothetical protein
MKAVKISNTLSGVEYNGTIKFLTTLTKESFELLRTRPFPESDINEAIIFFYKKDYLEEKLNQMQDKLDRLEGNGQILSSYQPITKREAEITEEEIVFIPDVSLDKNKEEKRNEDENRDLLLGILGALEEDDKEDSR